VTKLWLIGAKKLVVEVDAQYIKGMLNKLNLHPNAAMNGWIAVILIFDFELVHVPGTKHKGPDRLLRRKVADSEEEEEGIEEAEDWIDEIIGAGVWVVSCHDLAKWLSYYLYFFSYWTYNYKVECGKVSRDFVTMV